jgi:signal transduction histidine kinase
MDLGTLYIRPGVSPTDARSKLAEALWELGASEQDVAQVACGISEVVRSMCSDVNNEGTIQISLEVSPLFAQVVFQIQSAKEVRLPTTISVMFKNLLKGEGGWTLSTPLVGVREKLSDKSIASVRRIIGAATKAELFIKIQEQNARLAENQRELRKALEEASRASQAKSTFLSNMSHELRTPLNSILGFTRRLRKTLRPEAPARERTALDTVLRNSNHLLSLIDGILDLSKVEAGRVRLEPSEFELTPLLQDVVTQCGILADKIEIHLNIEGAVTLNADRRKLGQVVTNLLSNAIKYGDHKDVNLSAENIQDDLLGDAIAIRVIDQGQGMTKEQISTLFRSYTRLSNAVTQATKGTGLGLAICARYVALHGGHINVHSDVGQGSTFEVVVPRDATSERAESARELMQTKLAEGVPERTVVYLDKETSDFPLVSIAFENDDVRVLATDRLEAAKALSETYNPDSIFVTDSWLGSQQDIEEAIKALGAQVKVLETASVPLDQSSVRLFMRKPVDLDVLPTVIEEVAGGKVKTALVVEDMPDVRELRAYALQTAQIETKLAANGSEAVALLNVIRPQVILLDLLLPEMSGFELLESLEILFAEVPVIVLSSLRIDPVAYRKIRLLRSAVLQVGSQRPVHSFLGDRQWLQ